MVNIKSPEDITSQYYLAHRAECLQAYRMRYLKSKHDVDSKRKEQRRKVKFELLYNNLLERLRVSQSSRKHVIYIDNSIRFKHPARMLRRIKPQTVIEVPESYVLGDEPADFWIDWRYF